MKAVLAFVSAAMSIFSNAHEGLPAYLEINTLQQPEQYGIIWKRPLVANRPLAISPIFPRDCKLSNSELRNPRNAALIQHSKLVCSKSMDSRSISIRGLQETGADVVVRVRAGTQYETNALLGPSSDSFTLKNDRSIPVMDYLLLGIQHLVFGLDHVLFVVCLMFFVPGIGPLIKVITGFTIAHSVTLGLSAMQIISVPQAPIEAVIALSIVFLSIERIRDMKDTLSFKHTWIVSVIFGLLHGFGFAGILHEIGLPEDQLLSALLLFNLGVEIGQILVIALIFLGIATTSLIWGRLPQRSTLPVLYVIGGIGAFWFVDRSLSLIT